MLKDRISFNPVMKKDLVKVVKVVIEHIMGSLLVDAIHISLSNNNIAVS
jgi:hypothetical protein